ncbi:hypothetical protein EC2719100_1888 [Escherichia coli 2719100]|nr:hypothetical protein ECEPECC34262_2001 [Escherichia coli EPEC C342-62]EMX21172.1 hypothetical protein ECP03018671_1761 [Escherichia coli P0301867.1]EMX88275.1 hypothetical protein EC2719100_1888 [Escherichia coli 2719100]ENA40394.1 hypothetical protein ECP03018674_1692 [Escherichia coli P0301867.4]ENA45967.1 hypothetical protein ECP03018672_1722 [Escherichia coli P0301867.2]ENA64210.1 hypothetical protein EC178900_1567 [Escherichia coli 178900]ENC92090.1 hypothetical protein ECP030186711_1
MAQNYAGFVTKIAILNMKIGMTYTTTLHFQQGFAMFQ